MKPQEVTLFFNQLSILDKQNVPLTEALEVIGNNLYSTNDKVLVEKIRASVSNGNLLSDSIPEHILTTNKSNLIKRLIQIGEKSNTLSQVFTCLGQYLLADYRFKRSAVINLRYIYILFILAILNLGGILTSTLPRFKAIFTDMPHGLDGLPLLTRFMLSLSGYINRNLTLIILSFFVALFFWGIINKIRPLMYERLKIRVPFIGKAIIFQELGLFSFLLNQLLQKGKSLVEAWTIGIQGIENKWLKYKFNQVLIGLKNGDSLSILLNDSRERYLPYYFLKMINLGEARGRLEESFQEIGNIYMNQGMSIYPKLSKVLTLLSIIILAMLIGFIVISMYLPIFQLGNLGS
ncbi:MAG: type II secretion system F family protein [bacterium]